jgi:hypothetical protein
LPATVDGLPHCRKRVAAQRKFWVSDPETQAQNALIRKWDITSEQRSPDADVFVLTMRSTVLLSARHTVGRSMPSLLRRCHKTRWSQTTLSREHPGPWTVDCAMDVNG